MVLIFPCDWVSSLRVGGVALGLLSPALSSTGGEGEAQDHYDTVYCRRGAGCCRTFRRVRCISKSQRSCRTVPKFLAARIGVSRTCAASKQSFDSHGCEH